MPALSLKDVDAGEKAILAARDQPSWKGKPEPTVLLASYYSQANKPINDQEKVLSDYLNGPRRRPSPCRFSSRHFWPSRTSSMRQ